MKKKIILLLMIFIFIIVPFNKVKAKTLQDYYDELSALEKSYSDAKSKASMTQAELTKVRNEIASAEKEITNTSNEIEEAENSIKESEESIEEKKEQTNQMLLYLQLSNNEDSYLEYLFEASDYTDFIYRYSIVTQLGDYNNNLMEELNNLIEELQTKKQDLADKQEQLEKQKQELQSKYAVIQVQYQEEQSDGLDIQTQISEMKKLIKSYESSCGGKKNIDVSKCGAPAVDGWVYPLNSFYQSSSYAEFRDSYRHYAVDLAVSEGNSVKAVANGVVVASSLPSAKSSCYSEWLGKSYTNCHCGGYIIQIKHYYNGSYYISLYMHLLEGYVKTGDTVTKGQVIGISGGGVQEADKWSDYCTAGAHLHFSMSYGDSLIGYSSSQGSTFNPVKFFPAMAGQGSSY